MANKYFLYARKSQERDDRQIVSLEDQIRDMKSRARKKGLNIVQVFEEAKSAKKRGRPIFNEMIQKIKNGEADGILCWRLNRLARNAYDGGEITDLLHQGVIKEIETFHQTFYPESNVMYILFEFGMATQYVKDLSGDVKRGLREKAIERGWYPLGVLPPGYRHNTDPKTLVKSIVIDENKFYIVKELWTLLLTGVYSISEIRRKAYLLNLTTKNGGQYSNTSFKRYFTNPFYAGYFFWRNQEGEHVRVMGQHPPMITEGQFHHAQCVLNKNGRDTRSSNYDFPYRGILRCGECSGSITVEKKSRAICTNCKNKFSIIRKKECTKCGTALTEMNNPSILNKVYYHCIGYTNPNCSQKSVSESHIEEVVLNALKDIEIDDEMYNWGIQLCSKFTPLDGEQVLLSSLKNKKRDLEKKIKKLIELRLNEEISASQHSLLSNEYENDLKDISEEIAKREFELENWQKEAQEYFQFAHHCVKRFKSARNFEKRMFIQKFFSNPIILNKTLCFSWKKVPFALSPEKT